MFSPEIRPNQPQEINPLESGRVTPPTELTVASMGSVQYPGDDVWQSPEHTSLVAPAEAGAAQDMADAVRERAATNAGALALSNEHQEDIDNTLQPTPSDADTLTDTEASGQADQQVERRAWARGEAREALIKAADLISKAHAASPDRVPGFYAIFARSGTAKEYLPLLLQPDLSYAEIAARLGETNPEYPATVVRRALERLYEGDQVPPELRKQFPEPTGPVYGGGAQKEITVGGRLSALRSEADVTIDTLAQAVGMSSSALHRFFSGKVLPPPEKVASIMGLLGVDSDQAKDMMQDYVTRRYKNPERQAEALDAFEVEEPDPYVLAAIYRDQWPNDEPTVESEAVAETTEPAEKSDATEVDPDESSETAPRRWANGQQRDIIRRLSDALEAAGEDPMDYLPPSSRSNMRALLPLLRGQDLSYKAIVEALKEQGVEISLNHMSTLISRISDQLISKTPAEHIPKDLSLQPEGSIVEERTDHAAAPIKAMLKEQGLTYEMVARVVGKSRESVLDFMNGLSYPRPSEVLVPVCKMLGLSEEETAAYIASYLPERQAHTTRRRT